MSSAGISKIYLISNKLYNWLIHIRSNQLGIEDLPEKE